MEREEWSSCSTSHELDLSSVSDHDNVLYDCTMRYFTSDLHLGSTLINKYAHRPFPNAGDAMLAHVIAINKVCTADDVLIHVGDFMLDGADRHGEVEDVGLDHSREYYLKKLFPRVTLLAGNHDDGHNCEADCKSMVLDLNQNWRNVYVNHFPSDNKDYHGLSGSSKRIQVNLCGHVHDKWLLKYDAAKHVLNVNVGVDVWGYKPVRDAEITDLLDYYTKHCPIHDITGSFSVTRAEFENLRSRISEAIKTGRMQRKAEKLKKKGLTPEECERRKIEAMKKKGLI